MKGLFTRSYILLLLLALIALFLAVPRPITPGPLIIGAVIMAVLLALGLRAAAPFGRGAPILENASSKELVPAPGRRLGIALLIGVVMGGFLLGLLIFLASKEPLLRTRLAERANQPAWMPWALAVEASILEEIIFRLFLMSGVIWLAPRILRAKRRDQASPALVWTAIGISALAFGLVHLPSWTAAVHPTLFLVASVLALNGAAGVVLGWIYWNWGIEAAILCHFAGDMMLQGIGPRLMGS
ncbi:MAG TPA: CPBP family intramembrane glutamic endopeptidase [Candidatus Polarisedimenticolia bacterium]|nr:CPBP family intramembrane glutamic endopeptidase [Candidatus Polarisedimenticolia bacterium]